MHVALFSPGWPLQHYQNGIVTYVHWMRLELERRGHRVSVFAGTVAASGVDANIHLVQRGRFSHALRRIARPIFSTERNIFDGGRVLADAVLAVHRRDPIDIIEMEESFGWSAEVESRTGIPVLVKLHGPAFLSLVDEELNEPFGRERIRREGEALARAQAIASPSHDTLLRTIARYQLSPAIREHVVNPLTMSEDVAQWKLSECNRKTILFVGRFDRRKGGDIVLQAFELLLRERPDLTLVFVGPDAGLLQPDGRRVHLAEFSEKLFSPEQRKRVNVRGRLNNRDIPALRVQAMVTVVASLWENQGYTVLEAMFQGCPIVASDIGGNPECVIQRDTGLLARPEDPADFAAQLAFMLDHPDAAAEMGARARRHVIEKHAAGKVAADSLALYERVIAQRSSERAGRR